LAPARSVCPALCRYLGDIQNAETRKGSEAALTVFSEKYGVKYKKGVANLKKVKEAMLVFYGLRSFVHLNGPPDY
jgi:putative transposase